MTEEADWGRMRVSKLLLAVSAIWSQHCYFQLVQGNPVRGTFILHGTGQGSVHHALLNSRLHRRILIVSLTRSSVVPDS
jgi:hypothetical protein